MSAYTALLFCVTGAAQGQTGYRLVSQDEGDLCRKLLVHLRTGDRDEILSSGDTDFSKPPQDRIPISWKLKPGQINLSPEKDRLSYRVHIDGEKFTICVEDSYVRYRSPLMNSVVHLKKGWIKDYEESFAAEKPGGGIRIPDSSAKEGDDGEISIAGHEAKFRNASQRADFERMILFDFVQQEPFLYEKEFYLWAKDLELGNILIYSIKDAQIWDECYFSPEEKASR